MADEPKLALGISKTGGPTVTVHPAPKFGITLSDQCVGVAYRNGVRDKMPVGEYGSGGTFYGFAGVTASAGFNYSQKGVGRRSSAGSDGNTDTEISVPNAAAALERVRQITDGSYDMNQASIKDVAKLAERFPSLLNSKQREWLEKGGTAVAGKNTTIGQVIAKSQEFIDVLDNIGGPENLAKLRIAEQYKKGIILSPSQQAEVLANIENKQSDAKEIIATFSDLPDPTTIQHEHKLADKVTKYAPEVKAGVVLAGAYVSPRLGEEPYAAYVALGGNLKAGGVVDSNSILANLNRRVHVKVDPVSSASLYAGIGTSPSVAVPIDQANQLGIPSEQGTNIGAYAQVTQQQRSGWEDKSSLKLALQLSTRIRDGMTVTGTIAVQKTPHGDTRTTAQIGLNF